MSFLQNLSRFQKTKLTFIGIYFIFNLIILIVSFRLSLNNIRFLVDISNMIPYAKYIASLGMLLFFSLVIIHYIEIRKVRKELDKNVKDIHMLKSKLYDLEEREKAAGQKNPSAQQESK